jgi:HEAT repeat protein
MAVDGDPVPELIGTLRRGATTERLRAAQALGRLGPLALEALPALADRLSDPDESIRSAAAAAAGQMGPTAVPILRRGLSHFDKQVRRQSVWALGRIGPPAAPAVPDLCIALKDLDPRTGTGAAQALGAIGPAASAAAPYLIAAISEANQVLSRLAVKALSLIGPPAVPALLGALTQSEPFLRGEAALALSWMGDGAHAAVTPLIEMLRVMPRSAGDRPIDDQSITPPGRVMPRPVSPDSQRLYAVQALGRIGPSARDAIPALTEALTDADERVRDAALQALSRIRGTAPPM